MGRGLIDIIISISIILVLGSIFTGYLVRNLEEARNAALENQLTNLKYSVNLYSILEGRYPDDLRDLSKNCKARKKDSLYGNKYLEHQNRDKEGYPIDPYGRRFIYDRKTGMIKRGAE